MNRSRLFAFLGILTGFALGLTTSASASRYAFGEREVFLAPGQVQAVNTLLDGTGVSFDQGITDDGTAAVDMFIDLLPDIEPDEPEEESVLRIHLVSLPEEGLTLTGLEGEEYNLAFERAEGEHGIVDYGGVVLLSGLR